MNVTSQKRIRRTKKQYREKIALSNAVKIQKMKCLICWLHFSTPFWLTSVRKQLSPSLRQVSHHNISLFLMQRLYLQMAGSSFITSCLWAHHNGLGGENKQISLFWLILLIPSLLAPAYFCFVFFVRHFSDVGFGHGIFYIYK